MKCLCVIHKITYYNDTDPEYALLPDEEKKVIQGWLDGGRRHVTRRSDDGNWFRCSTHNKGAFSILPKARKCSKGGIAPNTYKDGERPPFPIYRVSHEHPSIHGLLFSTREAAIIIARGSEYVTELTVFHNIDDVREPQQ